MDSRPIGVFDSGLGGLTAVRQLRRILPEEKIVYFGDTGRVPYGSRGRETITRYAAQGARLLLDHQVKVILSACGTVSSVAGELLEEACPCPYLRWWPPLWRPPAVPPDGDASASSPHGPPSAAESSSGCCSRSSPEPFCWRPPAPSLCRWWRKDIISRGTLWWRTPWSCIFPISARSRWIR